MSSEPINSYNAYNTRILNNKRFFEILYKELTSSLSRPLSNAERSYVIDVLRTDNPNKFLGKYPSEILTYYVQNIIKTFKTNGCSQDTIDIHEINKSQIGLPSDLSIKDFGPNAAQRFVADTSAALVGNVGISSLLGVTNMSEILSIISPDTAIKHEYIVLDSRYRSLDNDGTLYFQWNAVYDDSNIQGGFNINQRVENIVSMKCYPIKMPYVSSADNDYGRVTLLMQEFQSQSFVANENTKFHFVFATDVQDRWIHLRAHNYNDGIHRFATPLTQLSSLTISFGSPLQPIVFDQDRLTMTVSSYGTTTAFTSNTPHNLETGDLVYISGFNSFNPASDGPIIGAINNLSGNVATTTDQFSFTIDVNSTTMNLPGAGTVSMTTGSAQVIGIGTDFIALFQINDQIGITVGPTTYYYTILTISTATQMILSTPFNEATGAYTYLRYNIIDTLRTPVYFGSKRLFLFLELSYLQGLKKN